MPSLEEEILDQLFFLISFDELHDQIDAELDETKATLIKLLEKGYVGQYQFNEQQKDFELLNPHLKINLEDYSYLATKEGLLKFTLG